MMRDDAMFKALDRLRVLLEDWAQWQQSYRPKLGYPSKSLTCYSESSQDFEGLCDAVDSATFGAVDACVQDLVPAQRAAVMRRYGIAAVFRFPRDNYESCLVLAHERLLVELPRKGVVL